jgi:hypothetical protein
VRHRVGCGQEVFHLVAQTQELLVLLDEHGQEHDLEGQEMGGVGGRGQVAAGGGQEVVEGDLVFAAQGAAEADERFLLGQEGLGDGGKGAAPRSSGSEQAGLEGRLGRRGAQHPDGVGGGLEAVE